MKKHFALSIRQSALLLIASMALAIFAGCSVQVAGYGNSFDKKSAPDEELALYMNDMQRYSQKLGFSIEEKNDRLSMFYLEELEEVFDALLQVDEVEGIPIAESIKVIMDPLVEDISESLRKEDWKQAAVHYEALIDGCNRCHAATERDYIVILPAKSAEKARYNQDFSR